MKKTILYYKNIAVIVLFCVIAGSCKKSAQVGSADELISNAKAWFQKSQEGLTISVYGQSALMPLRFTPQWEKAQTEVIEGNNVLLVPVNTNLNKSMGTQVQFNLIVRDNGEDYDSKVVSTRATGSNTDLKMSASDLFYAIFTDKNIADAKIINFDVTVFNSRYQATNMVRFAQHERKDFVFDRSNLRVNTKNPDGSLKMPKEDIFLNMVPPREGCTEKTWFLVECTYNDDGILLYYDILSQLPSTWICEGGGDTGMGETEQLDIGQPVSENDGYSDGPEENIGFEIYKTRTYRWIFHRSYKDLFQLGSSEIGRLQKMPDNRWKFVSFVHGGTWQTTARFGSLSHEIITAIPIRRDYMSSMFLEYTIERKAGAIGTDLQATSFLQEASKNFNWNYEN